MNSINRQSIMALGFILLLCQAVDVRAFHRGMGKSTRDGSATAAFGQDDIRLTHYSPFDYPIGHQLWSIVENEAGEVFASEQEGIRVLKAGKWKLITIENATTVRSLAASPSNTSRPSEILYYGAQGDFGMVLVDSLGDFVSQSLGHLVPDGIEYGDVWGTHIVENTVYFQAKHYIFAFSGRKVSYWHSENGFHNSFSVADRFFVREHEIGLKTIVEDDLVLLKGGEVLRREKVVGIVQNDSGKISVWTQKSGIWEIRLPDELVFDHPYSEELSQIAAQFRLYHISKISLNEYAIGTLGAGVLHVDEKGRIHSVLNDSTGLPDNDINFIYASSHGGYWVAFDSQGAGYVSQNSALQTFTRNHGIIGNIYKIGELGSKLTIATSKGLFQKISDQTPEAGSFDYFSDTPTKDVFSQLGDFSLAWDFLSEGNVILVATEDGVQYRSSRGDWNSCQKDQPDSESVFSKAFVLKKLESTGEILAGLDDGLARIQLNIVSDGKSECIIEHVETNTPIFDVRSIVESHGRVLLATRYDGIYDVAPSQLALAGVGVAILQRVDGVPPGSSEIARVFGRTFVVHKDGLFEYDNLTHSGVSRVFESSISSTSSEVFAAASFGEANLVVVFKDSVGFSYSGGGAHDWNLNTPRALTFPKNSTSSILVDSTGVVWFNNGSELIRYDPKYDVPGSKFFNAHIAEVKENSTGDVLFHGVFRAENGGVAPSQPGWAVPQLDYEERNLSFAFSATEFVNPDAVKFRFIIEGMDQPEWSEWSSDSETVTSSLKEGTYTLKAQAKDEIGRLSSETAYSFVILPPWFRTNYAYLAYFLLAILAAFSAHKYVLMRRAHKMALEQARELEREREVVKKLSEANDRLKQANKLKDEFLATTSHELRTPLTAILGFTSVLKEEIPEDADYREFLDIIEDSGSRLMDTLNSLLDLAKLRAGMMEINMEVFDAYKICMRELLAFQSAASAKNLKLKVVRPTNPMFALADIHGLSRVLHNLVGNAIKFTDEGSVTVEFEDSEAGLEIHIRDTGIGIDEEFLSNLFNAFIQESDGLSRTHEGNGLGLAISSGIVGLMEATIRVESEKGAGSDFVVTLQKGLAPRLSPIAAKGVGFGASA